MCRNYKTMYQCIVREIIRSAGQGYPFVISVKQISCFLGYKPSSFSGVHNCFSKEGSQKA